jgi:hypothetical protein
VLRERPIVVTISGDGRQRWERSGVGSGKEQREHNTRAGFLKK